MNRNLVQNAVENIFNRDLTYMKNEARNIIDGEETISMIDYSRVVAHLDAIVDEIVDMFCEEPSSKKEDE